MFAAKKLEAALARVTALEALITAADFELPAADAPLDENALAAFVTQREQAAAEGATTAAATELSALTAALEAKGIELPDLQGPVAADESQGVEEVTAEAAHTANVAAVGEAIETLIAQRAAAMVAQAGHDALSQTSVTDDATGAAAEPQTEAEYHAALSAETDPAKKWNLFEAMQQKFPGRR